MSLKLEFINLVTESVRREVLKKLVFSRPKSSEISKVSARLCSHRGNRVLALEYSLPGNTVSQKNIKESLIQDELSGLVLEYKQANLITTLGNAEYKISKSDKEVLLGGDSLLKRLDGNVPNFESAIEALDKRKNYILKGDEDFLIALGISDKNGRVHDKRQAKYRQINRFLEHIEDIYDDLPKDRQIIIYDLCCGKSYLSFAVYYYLTAIKGRDTSLLGIDLKRDVIDWCDSLAKKLSYRGMRFICDDISNTPDDITPDMVISLHACDIATDIVLNRATALKAKIILSTPCCHKYLKGKIKNKALSFVTDYPQLSNKLCEAITDSIRLLRMSAEGYKVSALELTDPENTPKNTLLKAVREDNISPEVIAVRKNRYDEVLGFLLCDGKDSYLKEIK